MKINLFINDDSFNSNIVNFCIQLKRFKFVFQKLSDIQLLYNQRKLVILKENFLLNDFKKKLNKNIFSFSTNTCFFFSKKYNKSNLKANVTIINFPIKYIDFENSLLKIFQLQHVVFKNLELINDSMLLNKNNKKQTHLTEIEAEIILLLFKNKIINKNDLNKNVLNQSPLIDSKSLESHLYRLRKKLISIDSNKKIVLIEKKGLKIV